MQATPSQVDYLTKIILEIRSGTSPDEMDLCAEPQELEFIYGVAAEGITHFEKALFSKSAGEEICYHVETQTAATNLGHLRQMILDRIPGAPEFYLKVRIADVSSADQREVVRAIAAGTAGGCDCGCGCS
jgi:hypothetical protein